MSRVSLLVEGERWKSALIGAKQRTKGLVVWDFATCASRPREFTRNWCLVEALQLTSGDFCQRQKQCTNLSKDGTFTAPPPKQHSIGFTFCLNVMVPTNPFYNRCNNHPSLATWSSRRITISSSFLPSFVLSSLSPFSIFALRHRRSRNESSIYNASNVSDLSLSTYPACLPACLPHRQYIWN